MIVRVTVDISLLYFVHRMHQLMKLAKRLHT